VSNRFSAFDVPASDAPCCTREMPVANHQRAIEISLQIYEVVRQWSDELCGSAFP
jgi:hypothetical protein